MLGALVERVFLAHEVSFDTPQSRVMDGQTVFDLVFDSAVQTYRPRPAGPTVPRHLHPKGSGLRDFGFGAWISVFVSHDKTYR
jgi:hypothetical protein